MFWSEKLMWQVKYAVLAKLEVAMQVFHQVSLSHGTRVKEDSNKKYCYDEFRYALNFNKFSTKSHLGLFYYFSAFTVGIDSHCSAKCFNLFHPEQFCYHQTPKAYDFLIFFWCNVVLEIMSRMFIVSNIILKTEKLMCRIVEDYSRLLSQ